MENFILKKTLPKPIGDDKIDPQYLIAGRYGTDDSVEIWGPTQTYGFTIEAQSSSIETMSDLYPDIVPPEHKDELVRHAKILPIEYRNNPEEHPEYIDPKRIREIELKGQHDVDAINRAWGEKVSPAAGAHINKGKTSADSTETAKALQLKESLEVYIDDLEILRDIMLEKGIEWTCLHMDETHLYDALPTLVGRPFMFYSEALQSSIDRLAYFYTNSIYGKWSDATGNHHGATDLGVDGMKLQREYCKKLGIRHMTASAQIPAREFIADIVYGMSRSAETLGSIAKYIRSCRGDDNGILRVPRGRKGSTAMPHKDAKGGNPIIEENTESFSNEAAGALTSSMRSIKFDYARDLTASAQDRVFLEILFKHGDFAARSLQKLVYSLELIESRSLERVQRTFGTITSARLRTYLTDKRRTKNPLPRKDADELAARLAAKAYDAKRSFTDIVLEDEQVSSMLEKDVIMAITDPMNYIGQSKEIMETVYKQLHGKKTFQL